MVARLPPFTAAALVGPLCTYAHLTLAPPIPNGRTLAWPANPDPIPRQLLLTLSLIPTTRYADAGLLEVSLITAPAAPGSSQCPDYAHAAKAPGSRLALSTVDTLWHAQASLHLPFPHLINYA